MQGNYILFDATVVSFRLLFLRLFCAVASVVPFPGTFCLWAVTFLVHVFSCCFITFCLWAVTFFCAFFFTFLLRLFVSCDCAVTFFFHVCIHVFLPRFIHIPKSQEEIGCGRHNSSCSIIVIMNITATRVNVIKG